MSSKKIITVFGATGAQGGGLVRAILNDKNSEFTVRAVTRDTNSEKAKELAGWERKLVTRQMLTTRLLSKGIRRSIRCLLCYFLLGTFFRGKRKSGGQNICKGCEESRFTTCHLVNTGRYTGICTITDDDRMPTLMEKYKVPHFDAKGESDNFFIEAGVPTTFLRASFYWDNFIYFGAGPKRG